MINLSEIRKYFAVGFAGLVISFTVWARDLGPYQLILDKQILGFDPVDPVPVDVAEVLPSPPSWVHDYRITMISKDGEGLRVGLEGRVDHSAYLLVEGEDAEISSFQLISGDFDAGTALIRFQGIAHRFTLENGSLMMKPEGPPSVSPEMLPGPVQHPLRERRIVRPISP